MSFIKLNEHFYNTDHIRKVILSGKDTDNFLEFINGEREMIPGRGFVNIYEKLTDRTVVAAQAGFTLLCFGDNKVERAPVIAWIVDRSGRFTTVPVTVHGTPLDTDIWSVMQPDGTVVLPCLQTWASYEAWLVAVNEERASNAA